MGELIGGCAGAIWQYARLFGGCSQEQEKINAIMEEVASVHNLLSKGLYSCDDKSKLGNFDLCTCSFPQVATCTVQSNHLVLSSCMCLHSKNSIWETNFFPANEV